MDTRSVNIIRVRTETRQIIYGIVVVGVFNLFIYFFIYIWLQCPVLVFFVVFLVLFQFVSLVFCFEECWIDSNNDSQKLEKNQFTLFDRKLKHKKKKSVLSIFFISNFQFISIWFPWFLLLRYWCMLRLEEKNKQKIWRELNTTKLLVH